jgi:uncharacterized protein YabE (DUF348 family)
MLIERLFMKKKAKKLFKLKKRQAEKKVKFLLRHPLLTPVAIFFVVIFAGLVMFVALGATTQGAKDVKIVDLYVDEKRQTVSTRAKTVEDLLDRLEINIIDEDIIEPSKDTLIYEDNTQVNVYRARPVSVVDKGRTHTVLSAQRAPRLIAFDAGLDLFPEDEVIPAPVDQLNSTLIEPAEKIIITRALEVQLNVYGVVSKKKTTEKTVQAFLAANDLTLSDGATLQPADASSPIIAGILIAINNVGIKTVAENEPIAFESETREDANLQVGESRVEVVGVNGEKSIIYEITEKDGAETERRALETVVITSPITEVIIRGKKPATLSASLSVSAEKTELMVAAGIAPADYPYVDYIMNKESRWRPGAVNSSSGAYGLCQAYPGTKMASAGADWRTNPVTQLRWCAGYAAGRYGGWQGAYNAWLVQSWW